MYKRDHILRNYYRYLTTRPHDPNLYDVVESVDELVATSPADAWEVIKELIDIAPDDDALGYLAAGPLENLLVLHGDEMAETIRKGALENRRVQDALARVFLPPISQVVKRALGEWLDGSTGEA